MAPWMNRKVVMPLTLADNRNCAANQPVSPFVKFFKEDPKDKVPPVHDDGSDGDSSDDDDDNDDESGDSPDATFNPQWNSTFDENNPDLNLSDSTVTGNSSNEHMDDSSEVQFRDDTDEVMFNFDAQRDRNQSTGFETSQGAMPSPRTRQQSRNTPYEPPRRFQFGSSESQSPSRDDVEMADADQSKRKNQSKRKSKCQSIILIVDGAAFLVCLFQLCLSNELISSTMYLVSQKLYTTSKQFFAV